MTVHTTPRPPGAKGRKAETSKVRKAETTNDPNCSRTDAPSGQATARRTPGPDYPLPLEKRVGPLWDALGEVMDPEIPISLVDLGLIYDIRQDGAAVEVDLTFTATACPCMFFIKMDIEERLLQQAGVEEVSINEVWNPAWTKARITPEGREKMAKFGVAS